MSAPKRARPDRRSPVAGQLDVPVVATVGVVQVPLDNFLTALRALAADQLLGDIVQRVVNEGKRMRPKDGGGISRDKMIAAQVRALTSRTTVIDYGDPNNVGGPPTRGPEELWRVFGRRLTRDEAHVVVGGLYGLGPDAVKKIMGKSGKGT
jgi:hypothetical protein